MLTALDNEVAIFIEEKFPAETKWWLAPHDLNWKERPVFKFFEGKPLAIEVATRKPYRIVAYDHKTISRLDPADARWLAGFKISVNGRCESSSRIFDKGTGTDLVL
jgi:hypothetical protein